jgi:thioredoxin 1
MIGKDRHFIRAGKRSPTARFAAGTGLVYDWRIRSAPHPPAGRGIPPKSRGSTVNEKIIHITDDSFEQEVLQSHTPVLVDYWAEWCGPCKMIAPALDQIASEYQGRLKVAKLNIDENQSTPPKYGIRGIPTLMLFKNGNVEATKVGALSKTQLAAFIDSNI